MTAVKELDEFSFYSTIEESKGIVLVFFSGPHCASCHHLKELFEREISQFTQSFPHFSVYEIKADKATALVNEFSVFHLPTMFLYRDGRFHCELHAEAHPKKIIEAINIALEKPAEEEP